MYREYVAASARTAPRRLATGCDAVTVIVHSGFVENTCALTRPDTGRELTVGAFVSTLAESLNAMRMDQHSFVVVASFADHRYVQFYISDDGIVIGEVISNLNVGDLEALRPEAEDALRKLGFAEPSHFGNPNWSMTASSTSELERLRAIMETVVYEILREQPQNLVIVSSWYAPTPSGWTSEQARMFFRVHVKKRIGAATV